MLAPSVPVSKNHYFLNVSLLALVEMYVSLWFPRELLSSCCVLIGNYWTLKPIKMWQRKQSRTEFRTAPQFCYKKRKFPLNPLESYYIIKKNYTICLPWWIIMWCIFVAIVICLLSVKLHLLLIIVDRYLQE